MPPGPRYAAAADPSSFANWKDVCLEHLDLHVAVSFETKALNVTATWTGRTTCSTNAVIFDTKRLAVEAVRVDGEVVEVTKGEEDPVFGAPLEVALPTAKREPGSAFQVELSFRVGEESSALQWLAPEQTAGKQHPFLFTQCQAIHARALLPCHDSPGVKFTYKAEVVVPSWATALMSALAEGAAVAGSDARRFVFHQPVAISSYLVAIAVGELEGRPVGPRSTAWAEPAMVEAVQQEFAEHTEKFLQAAEEITGLAYAWGRYDILCLPPSFPYGGMENPCLTFCTPTLLAGDASLAGVIAHEIAHSWTGNLITNASWEHFWLNEGWTVWLERQILAKVGSDKVFDLHALSGLEALQGDVDILPPPLTRLVPDLRGKVDPDDAFSRVPYEKGFNLLLCLADAMGGDAVFADFVKAYIRSFQRRTITSDEFRSFVEGYCAGRGLSVSAVDLESWFYDVGMPPSTRAFDHSLADQCSALAEAWAEDPERRTADDVAGWTSAQRQRFLDALRSKKPAKEQLPRLAELYGLKTTKNCEERFRWYMLCLDMGDESHVSDALGFVTSVGRMKYVRPLYRALFHHSPERALEAFQGSRPNYHPIAQHMIAKDLGLRS